MAGSQKPLRAGLGCWAALRSSAPIVSAFEARATFPDDDFECMKYYRLAADDEVMNRGQPLTLFFVPEMMSRPANEHIFERGLAHGH